MDRLDTIELFVAVVETGSFSEAGRRFGYAPSAVTRRMDDLERWMGATLFYRSTRKITLTEVGDAFHRRASSILLEIEEARVTAAGLEDMPTGTVRMSVAASLGPQITAALNDFQEQWQGIRIAAMITDQLVDPVAEGLDLLIRIGRLEDSALRARLIGRGDRVLCASPGYIKNNGEPMVPEDLKSHNCLIFRATPGHNIWRFKHGRRQTEIRAEGLFQCDDGQLLVQAAIGDMGIVLLPRWLVARALADGDLRPILDEFEPDPADTPVYAVHPYTRFIPPKVRVLVDFLAGRFTSEEHWT